MRINPNASGSNKYIRMVLRLRILQIMDIAMRLRLKIQMLIKILSKLEMIGLVMASISRGAVKISGKVV